MLTLLEFGEDSVRIAVTVYLQLTRYGWTSAKAIDNLLHVDNKRVIGGTLSGLQRAGLIARGLEPQTSSLAAALMIEPHPVFLPGPEFPVDDDVEDIHRSASLLRT